MATVTVTITNYCEGEAMDVDFQVYRHRDEWAVGLKGDPADLFFDTFSTYFEAIEFALEAHGSAV